GVCLLVDVPWLIVSPRFLHPVLYFVLFSIYHMLDACLPGVPAKEICQFWAICAFNIMAFYVLPQTCKLPGGTMNKEQLIAEALSLPVNSIAYFVSQRLATAFPEKTLI